MSAAVALGAAVRIIAAIPIVAEAHGAAAIDVITSTETMALIAAVSVIMPRSSDCSREA